jgi:hypothetical protein
VKLVVASQRRTQEGLSGTRQVCDEKENGTGYFDANYLLVIH